MVKKEMPVQRVELAGAMIRHHELFFEMAALAIGVLQGLTDGRLQAIHLSFASPEPGWQGSVMAEIIMWGVIWHFPPSTRRGCVGVRQNYHFWNQRIFAVIYQFLDATKMSPILYIRFLSSEAGSEPVRERCKGIPSETEKRLEKI